MSDSTFDPFDDHNYLSRETCKKDGRGVQTPVWFVLHDGALYVYTEADSWKVKRIRNNPRVAMSVITGGRSEHGLDKYLVVEGEARITEGGAPQLLQRLAERYVGPGVKFPPMDNPPPGFITRVTPTKIGGICPWA